MTSAEIVDTARFSIPSFRHVTVCCNSIGRAVDVAHLSVSSSWCGFRLQLYCPCTARLGNLSPRPALVQPVPEFCMLHAQQRRIRSLSLSLDGREITGCVVVPAKIGCRPIRCVHPGLFRVTGQEPQFASMSPAILKRAVAGSNTGRRCEAPGDLHCFVRIDRRLRHRPDSFACELNVGSIQCNEQVSHASALEASGLVSWQKHTCKRVLRQERGCVPKYSFPSVLSCSMP